MNKLYQKGYYYERKVKQILEKDGYLVWRSPASKSPIDIIAINDKGYIKLIQVKRKRYNLNKLYLNREEFLKIYELAKKFENTNNVDIEIWAFLGNKLEKYNKKDILTMLLF
jgi:Holliday junction resolvase